MKPTLSIRMPAVLAGVLALTAAPATYGGLAPATAAPAASSVVRTYAALPATTAVTNPERGFFHRRVTYFKDPTKPGFVKYRPLDGAELTSWRVNEGLTLVHRMWYLDRYVTDDTFEPDVVAKVKNDFAIARASGVKLLVRFAYSDSTSADAPPTIAKRHIEQLAPVLNTYAAQIFGVEAGFIGKYGEWWESASYPTDDWTARGAVLNTLLDTTSASIPVLVRKPGIKQNIVVPATGPRARRVGVHNDCFLAGQNDAGTYLQPTDRQWLHDQTKSVLMAGETCAPGPRSPWSNAKLELARYHWTALYRDYNVEVLDSWGAAGLAETKARLGHRLRLISATLPTKARAGQPMNLQFTFANNGYSILKRTHPSFLVLQGAAGTDPIKVRLPMDLTRVLPQPEAASRTFSVVVTTPPTTGTYTMYLAVQDSASPLAGKAEYNIAMANANMWTAAKGWNSLASTLTVER